MMIDEKELRNRINSMCTHVLFNYHEMACGIDPLSRDEFDMWCGDDVMTAGSIDEVMQTPFFDGNALQDILEEIENIEF